MANNRWEQFRQPQGFMGRLLAKGMNRGHLALVVWSLSLIRRRTPTKMLDVGCGGGGSLRELMDTFPQASARGIDPSEACLTVARKVTRDFGRRCQLQQGAAEKIPCQDESFDLVTAYETVYFWPDLSNGLAEIWRVLEPGGRLLLACELSPSEKSRKYEARIAGMKIYSRQELAARLEQAGFTNIEHQQDAKGRFCLLGEKQGGSK
ncbi:putative methyltransferase [Streptococcus sp. DD11]|uniref:class I SAM-dependent methyltransferase n=1 Tax=Streptococcus sp. DD11 TaxID=1777879 RepID=UPI00079676C4|nr:class I SAM-dependent methyltransferase [Streptococcus sp. DD11]KXT83611.1 putative methyltransferase [Streptococcus sp. DD11]